MLLANVGFIQVRVLEEANDQKLQEERDNVVKFIDEVEVKVE